MNVYLTTPCSAGSMNSLSKITQFSEQWTTQSAETKAFGGLNMLKAQILQYWPLGYRNKPKELIFWNVASEKTFCQEVTLTLFPRRNRPWRMNFPMHFHEWDSFPRFRSTTLTLAMAITPTRWHFAAHMGQLLRYTGDSLTGPTGCSQLWPQCPFSSQKLMRLSSKMSLKS